ncbi:hypothetical protein GH5_01921 [Leishmania sp. Ghana 2012 LV757]|uniref:hypothetical protein n=1 Tax=Leishmania sp. Ghana 2012 LV757 TaxID=2803181 RepID=UPI001B4DE287|nr:hypothetical protein GH5_01921 [Leishmania sp. Ghana 2012 LV757]
MRRRVAFCVVSYHRPEGPIFPFLYINALGASRRWQPSRGSSAHSTRHGAGRHMANIPNPEPAEKRETQTTSEVAEDPIPHGCVLDWSGGSAYYFSEAEVTRLHSGTSHKALDKKIPRQLPAAFSTKGDKSAGTDTEKDGGEALQTATIHGVARNFLVDLSVPPLRREEVERWNLDWYLFRRCYNATLVPAHKQKRRNQLLPSTAMVTYLGPDMRKIDQLHREKGFFTPSEIAEVFIPLVPTFWVESRHVMAAVPPAILQRLEKAARGMSTLAQVVFEHYPMLFHYSPCRFRRALVRLNSQFWFVRQHPGYGKADRALLQFRNNGSVEFDPANADGDDSGVEPLYAAAERAAAEAVPSLDGRASVDLRRRPWSVEMLSVLVKNLPRVPTPEGHSKDVAGKQTLSPTHDKPFMRERYRPLNLVQWINSFPPDDLAVVNKAPQVSVVQLITQYVHVFQLMSLRKGDHNLFVEGHVLLSGGAGSEWKADAVAWRASSPSGQASVQKGGEASLAQGASDDDDEMTGWWSVDNAKAPKEVHTAEHTAESPEEGDASSTINDRERAFKQAVTEELIGLESLVEERGAGATVLGSERDSIAFAHDADDAADTAFGCDGDEEETYHDDGSGDDEGAACWQHERHSSQPLEPPKGASMSEVTAFGLPLEELYVRRLPPDVAPRSLSDLDQDTSPDPELLAIAASFLASPPSLQSASVDCFFRRCRRRLRRFVRPVDEVWRWVEVKRLYAAFTAEQRRLLRDRYRGLVGFLRYHGKIFELSSDLMYVIAHDPRGNMAPIPPMQRVFRYANRVYLPDDFDDNPDRSASVVGEAERRKFTRVLGEGAIPTFRRHLLLLDPDNPLMQHEVLYDEIANLLPDRPVPLQELLAKLPPVMRAALPHMINIGSSKRIDAYVERGRTMIRKKTVDQPSPAAPAPLPQMSVEEAIAELLQLPVGGDAIALKALVSMHLSDTAASTLADHFGSVGRAVRMLPQYFEVWDNDTSGRKKMIMVRRRL